MKKVKILLLCAALLLTTGCAWVAQQAKTAAEDGYFLYFTVEDLQTAQGGDAIGSEQVVLTELAGERSVRELAEELVQLLLAGPTDERLKSPIPSGTALRSITLDGTQAMVDFTSQYGTLSGVALTMADYCITLTLTQIEGISTVCVTVGERELAYREHHVFTAQEVLLTSKEDVVGTLRATLYYLDESGSLTALKRTLDLYEGDTQAQALVSALRADPGEKGLLPAIPEEFTTQSVWIKDRQCSVNLAAQLLESFTADQIETATAALRLSFNSLDTVDETVILVDGKPSDRWN